LSESKHIGLRKGSRNTPLNRLKIPVLAYQKANKAGILPAVLFYYELKRLTVEGYFGGTRYVEFIRRRTGLAPATIYRGFALLAKAGLACRETGKISLVSYDKLFSLLGLQIGGKGGARLLKVAATGNVEDNWQAAEIGNNLAAQQAALEHKYVLALTGKRDTDKAPSRRLKKRLLEGFDRLTGLNNFLGDILNSPRAAVHCDVSLTCLKVAQLFGYTSATKGHQIERRLEAAGRLSVETRVLTVLENFSRETFFSLRLQDSSFFLRAGRLVKQLPNLLKVC
jgi:hypothetical protein